MGKRRLAALSGLPPAERYRVFVEAVADSETLWGLRGDDAWAAARGEDGRLLLPVWPRPELAEACAVGDWAPCAPAGLPLAGFLDAWLPGLAREARAVSVFPTPTSPGVIVPPEQLAEDLAAAVARLR